MPKRHRRSNPSHIRRALNRKGNLVSTGLLKTTISAYDNFHIDPMEGLSQALVCYHENESELLGRSEQLHLFLR